MKKSSPRVVWSALYGGCLMIQQMLNGCWCDWNSYQEGEHPTNDARVKLIVKWENLRLRKESLDQSAKDAQMVYFKKLAKSDAVAKQMGALSEQIREIKP